MLPELDSATHLSLSLLDSEGIRPLSGDSIQNILASSLLQGRSKAVLLATEPSLSAVVDFGVISARRLDNGRLFELNVWSGIDESFDMESG